MPLQFLFWQPSIIQRRRLMTTTLDNVREGGGFSGTDTSMLEVADGLVSRGHGVRVLSGGPASRRSGSAGCTYLSPERTFLDTQHADLVQVDVLVVVFMMPEAPAHAEMMDLLRRLSNPNLRVLCWCHLIYQETHIALLRNACIHRGLRMTLVCVSDFVRGHLAHQSSELVTIPNGIHPDIFRATDTVREPHSFVFCASFERGGRIAQAVYALLQDRGQKMGTMHLCSYCDADKVPSLSKRALAQRMVTCDYMVYPLVLDNGTVHHDTYASVVLEAMACGVLVVSWDVACLRGVYGDLITLVPPPPWPGYDPQAVGGSNLAMLEPTSVSVLADAVSALMALSSEQREARREAARSWAQTQTWDLRVRALVQVLT